MLSLVPQALVDSQLRYPHHDYGLLTLLSILLLATAALVVRSSLAEASFTRGHEDGQSRSTDIDRVASRADAASEVGHITGGWGGGVRSEVRVRVIPIIHDHVRSHFLPTA